MATIGIDSIAYLHCPRTGGTFTSSVIRDAIHAEPHFVGEETPGVHKHATLDEIPIELLGEIHTAITTIRNPVTWYHSIWCLHMVRGWGSGGPMEAECGRPIYEKFLRRIMDSNHRGHASRWMRKYLRYVDVVLRTEDLPGDLRFALRMAVGSPDEKALYQARDVNSFPYVGKEGPIDPEDYRDLVLEMDGEFMEEWGYA